MNLILDGLNFELHNPNIQDNDVHVDFEYEKLGSHEVKFFLNAYIGQRDEDYRFYLRLIYKLDFVNEDISDESLLVQKSIDSIVPSFTELITIIDSLVKQA